MTKKNPTVSIIMPVYNGGRYVSDAIESMLGQTFSDYEFIIIDDGSADDTERILRSFDDPRIIHVKNERNSGIVKTLNRGISMASGEYIVRMDADDISCPDRIGEQVDFMNNNPRISISGSWIECFGSKNEKMEFPTSVSDVQCGMLLTDEISNSSVIIRKKDISAKNLTYLEKHRYENEYHFTIRAIMAGLKIANIPEVLLKKRMHQDQMSAFFESRVRDVEIMEIQKEYFFFLIKNMKFMHPKYLSCMIKYIQIRFRKKSALVYRKMYLKKMESDFYGIGFKNCFHINCDIQELGDKNIVDIATVAFNNAEVIRWQIRLIRKNLRDTYFHTVFDNSNDDKKAEEIRNVCAAENIAYVKLPENHLTRSSSHGSALNWIYRNYFTKRGAAYFGFLDHDIFPIKETSLMAILNNQSLYGHLQERGSLWYLWAGFCFFRSDSITQNLNFLDGKIKGAGVDTGGMNWEPIYSKLDKGKISFPKHRYERIRESRNPTAKMNDPSLDMVEYIGDWMHVFGSSGWKTIRNQNERDEKIRAVIDKLL